MTINGKVHQARVIKGKEFKGVKFYGGSLYSEIFMDPGEEGVEKTQKPYKEQIQKLSLK